LVYRRVRQMGISDMPNDNQLDFFKLRLNLIGNASESARWFLAAAVVASIIQISVVYNDSLSQTRDLGEDLVAKYEGNKTWNIDNPTTIMQQELMKQWVDSTFIAVPPLGIRISVADVTLLGSAAVTALSFCLFVGLKRENRLVRHTIDAAKDAPSALKELIYETVFSTQVFSVAGTPVLPTSAFARGNRWQQGLTNFLSRLVAILLFLLPFVAVATAFTSDIFSVENWKADLFREQLQLPIMPWYEVWLRGWIPAILFGSLTLAFGIGAWRLQRNTASLALKQNSDKLTI
jgi:hypothetical protein